MPQYHASCIEWMGAGVLLCGTPGSGKSDICLRLTETGAQLVADDRTELEYQDGRLAAYAPARLAGLLEVRGIGIIKMPFKKQTFIKLKVILCRTDEIARMPARETELIENVEIPVFRVDAFTASAPAKIRLAVQIANNERKVVS